LAKREWSDLSEDQVVRRLGKLLDVGFVTEESVGLGGIASGLADVGGDAWVALEVEHKHAHPTENVLQYWPWLERNNRRLVLIHAIAPDARKREGHRSELTKWLGALMERVLPGRFAYCRLELGTDAEAVQLDAVVAAIAAVRQPHGGRKLAPGL
jgi:hypothetical protein